MSDDLYIGPTALEPGPREPSVSSEHLARLILLPLTLLFVAIVLVFFVFFQPIHIDGPSMMPTLRSADCVLITRGARDVARGDVVVLVANDQGIQTELVKRVIGLAGDVVEIRGDVAYINGAREPIRGQVVVSQYATSFSAVTVPAGQIYVMGDNRAQSEDSRYIGTVPLSGVVGRVVAVFAPIQRLRFVS